MFFEKENIVQKMSTWVLMNEGFPKFYPKLMSGKSKRPMSK